MPSEEQMYGLADDEQLESEAEDVVERVLADACETPGEPFEATAARVTWPIKVYVFKRMKVGESAESIGNNALERVLDNLDEELGDPDGDPFEPTSAMKEAALAFGKAILADYKPWAGERTGEVIEFTREQMAKEESRP
jgi:hypothetical protein